MVTLRYAIGLPASSSNRCYLRRTPTPHHAEPTPRSDQDLHLLPPSDLHRLRYRYLTKVACRARLQLSWHGMVGMIWISTTTFIPTSAAKSAIRLLHPLVTTSSGVSPTTESWHIDDRWYHHRMWKEAEISVLISTHPGRAPMASFCQADVIAIIGYYHTVMVSQPDDPIFVPNRRNKRNDELPITTKRSSSVCYRSVPR